MPKQYYCWMESDPAHDANNRALITAPGPRQAARFYIDKHLGPDYITNVANTRFHGSEPVFEVSVEQKTNRFHQCFKFNVACAWTVGVL